MNGVEIDSEARQNLVETIPKFGPSTHCVIIMEQPPLMGIDSSPPKWWLATTITLVDPALGPDPVLADLPTVFVGPMMLKMQVVAIAKYPGLVTKWSFRFGSDTGRSKSRVWLHPGTSPQTECGVCVLRYTVK